MMLRVRRRQNARKVMNGSQYDSRPSAYDPMFTGTEVAVPGPGLWSEDLLAVEDRTQLDYAHFSLATSMSRKLARWVAWNIDGSRFVKDDDRLSRDGLDFRPDTRAAGYQTLEPVYRPETIDRGHIARRADLLWGTVSEAAQANYDSFYFTNICPQMDDFNQSARHGMWGLLENAVMAETKLDHKRLAVMGGPVLQHDDPEVEGVQVPLQFWKLIAYRVSGETRLRCFKLAQVLRIEVDVSPLDAFGTYELSPRGLEELTGLDFGPTHSNLVSTQSLEGESAEAEDAEPRLLTGLGDIQW